MVSTSRLRAQAPVSGPHRPTDPKTGRPDSSAGRPDLRTRDSSAGLIVAVCAATSDHCDVDASWNGRGVCPLSPSSRRSPRHPPASRDRSSWRCLAARSGTVGSATDRLARGLTPARSPRPPTLGRPRHRHESSVWPAPLLDRPVFGSLQPATSPLEMGTLSSLHHHRRHSFASTATLWQRRDLQTGHFAPSMRVGWRLARTPAKTPRERCDSLDAWTNCGARPDEKPPRAPPSSRRRGPRSPQRRETSLSAIVR